jgi:hypothetical protein
MRSATPRRTDDSGVPVIMAVPESRWLDSLAHHVGLDVDVAHIADVIVSTLGGIEAVLHPVVGRGGFDALYTRCVYLAGLAYPWLTGARGPVPTPVDLAALRAVLAQQTSAEAAAGGVALLQTLNDLLSTLIGGPLTEQLLGSVVLRPSVSVGAAAGVTLP